MLIQKKFKISFKTWLEYKGKPLLGGGGAEILKHVQERKSISKAAQALGMSYRYVWGYVRKMEELLDGPVLETFKGGKSGGGGARLTTLGISILSEYERLERGLGEVMSGRTSLEGKRLKIGAGNRLKGRVIAVEKGSLTARVKVEVTLPATVTAVIPKEAFEDLNIRVSDTVEAIVKATEITIGK